MGLRLFSLPNFPGATFFQGAMFIPDSRVSKPHRNWEILSNFCGLLRKPELKNVFECFNFLKPVSFKAH